MSTYEALVKVNVTDSLNRKLSDITEQLRELADRLVSEYDCDPDWVEDVFEQCIDVARDAGAERDGDGDG